MGHAIGWGQSVRVRVEGGSDSAGDLGSGSGSGSDPVIIYHAWWQADMWGTLEPASGSRIKDSASLLSAPITCTSQALTRDLEPAHASEDDNMN